MDIITLNHPSKRERTKQYFCSPMTRIPINGFASMGIQKFVYSSLFASISSVKTLSLSLIVAKHLFGIFWLLFKMKAEGFYFLFLD